MLIGIVISGVLIGYVCSLSTHSVPQELVPSGVIVTSFHDEYYGYVAVSTQKNLYFFHRIDGYSLNRSIIMPGIIQTCNITKIAHREPSSNIYVLFEGIQTYIYLYNYNQNNWSRVDIDIPSEMKINDIEIGTSDTQLYMATDEGLMIFDSSDNSTTPAILSTQDGLLSNVTINIECIASWVLVGFQNGFAIMDHNLSKHAEWPLWHNRQELSADCIVALEDLSRIYVGTSKGVKGFSFTDHVLRQIDIRNQVPDPLPSLEIKELEIDRASKSLYIGTGLGLCWYDIENEEWGTSLNGRIHPDYYDIQSLLVNNLENKAVLYIGSSSGMIYADMTIPEDGSTIGNLAVQSFFKNPVLGSYLLGIITFIMSSASCLLYYSQFKEDRKDARRDQRLSSKERSRMKGNLKTNVCEYLSKLEEDINNRSRDVDCDKLRDIIETKYLHIENKWHSYLWDVVKSVNEYNTLVETSEDTEIDTARANLGELVVKVRKVMKC